MQPVKEFQRITVAEGKLAMLIFIPLDSPSSTEEQENPYIWKTASNLLLTPEYKGKMRNTHK